MTAYQQAKTIYLNLGYMKDDTIDCINIARFRTHLSEFEYRKKLGKQFTTVILDNGQLLIKRIK
jgi:hypothetical protein